MRPASCRRVLVPYLPLALALARPGTCILSAACACVAKRFMGEADRGQGPSKARLTDTRRLSLRDDDKQCEPAGAGLGRDHDRR
jgi:hypothetical protein